MKRFAILVAAALLQLCRPAAAADFYTVVTVTVTNLVDGIKTNGADTLIVNADTRTGTNNVASNPSKLFLGTNNLTRATTNLYNHIALYAFGSASTRLQLQWMNTNQFRLIGQLNQVIAGSVGGVWGTLVSTNYPVTNRTTIFSPASGASPTTQTNFGNAIADYLNVATTFLNQTAAALSNFLSLHQPQTASNKTFHVSAWRGGEATGVTNLSGTNFNLTTGVVFAVTITGGNYGGFITALTNGWLWSNYLAQSTLSNATFVGDTVFSGSSASLLGSGVDNFISLTSTSTITSFGPVIMFNRIRGTNFVNANMSISQITFNGYGGVTYGGGVSFQIRATEDWSETSRPAVFRLFTTPSGSSTRVERFAIGPDGMVTNFNGLIVIGGTNGLIVLGTNISTAAIITNLTSLSGFLSNMFFASLTGSNLVSRDNRLSGTNVIDGDLSFTRFSNSGIINGNNSGIVIGTNVIVELSGATTIAQYAGFTIGNRDGDTRKVRMSGAVTNVIVDANDTVWSPDGTAARRIITGKAGALYLTNQPSWIEMIYRTAGGGRWEVTSHSE